VVALLLTAFDAAACCHAVTHAADGCGGRSSLNQVSATGKAYSLMTAPLRASVSSKCTWSMRVGCSPQ
jgi:hypothetical protein